MKAVDENAGPSTPVSMSGGKLQFNKGGAGIGKIRPKKGGSLAGAPIPKFNWLYNTVITVLL